MPAMRLVDPGTSLFDEIEDNKNAGETFPLFLYPPRCDNNAVRRNGGVVMSTDFNDSCMFFCSTATPRTYFTTIRMKKVR